MHKKELFLAVAILVACDSTDPPEIPGEYVLHTIAGRALPSDVVGGACMSNAAQVYPCVSRGRLTLETGGRYLWTFDYQSPSGTDPWSMGGHFADRGTWTLDAQAIELHADNTEERLATVVDGAVTLHLKEADIDWHFLRQ